MEKQEKKVETNNSLMRKTKVQLVDIILRKDSREVELLDQIKSLKHNINDYKNRLENSFKDISGMEKSIKKLEHERDSAKADFEYACDSHISDIQDIKDKCRLYKLATFIMTIVALLCIIFRYWEI